MVALESTAGRAANGSTPNGDSTWEQLIESPTVREQQAAFTCATGLPLTFLPASEGAAGQGSTPPEGVFCVEGCMGELSGRICEHKLLRAERRAGKASEPVQFRCAAGLYKILVPVLIGRRRAGNILAGPFSLHKPEAEVFNRLTAQLKALGLGSRAEEVRASWQYSPVITRARSRAVATLVNMFADYLAECGNRLLLRHADHASPLLHKIEAFLAEHKDESVSLKELAQRVSLSPCHFCKVFKKQTGLTFTEYRTRQRIEQAKRLLLDPQHRVAEVAFEAGFNSIPYFNRAFRRIVGCSPTEYRAHYPATNGGK